MPPRIAKQAVTCPKCKASQLEPQGVVSTFCRSCGAHFRLGSAAPKPPPGPRLPAWLRELIERFTPPKFREVRCFECGHVQTVPRVASSTTCGNCAVYIDVSDLEVRQRMTKTVRTRGRLVIKKGGFLNNQVTLCGEADIAGGAAGKVFCDHLTRIRTVGRLICELGSRQVLVDRKADVVVAHPIKAQTVDIEGKVTARIYCNGRVRVGRKGYLRGEVHARAFEVEPGGIFHGDLATGTLSRLSPELFGSAKERTCYMAVEDLPAPEQAHLDLPLGPTEAPGASKPTENKSLPPAQD